jgi:hypothetical protein
MQDALPIRLGGIAANLARVSTFSRNPANQEAVENLLDESKFMIEWSAPEADIETAGRLVELQIQLALWQMKWESIWRQPAQRLSVAEKAGQWSEQVLEMSGLLD